MKLVDGSRLESYLRFVFKFKEIGWESIGERFTRYELFKCRWFNIYLHQLNALNWHPHCHDHPWSFIAIVLFRGYLEFSSKDRFKYHEPGSVLYRPATFQHNVITPKGTSWSIIITTPKRREWGFMTCEQVKI